MALLRFVYRLLVLLPWVLGGLLTLALVFPWVGAVWRERLIRYWSRGLLRICGVVVRSAGIPLSGPCLVVANHVSWLDIFALNAWGATVFVAKAEIRRWPVLGWLVAGAGTLFIERGNRRAAAAIAQAMVERFSRGERLGLFPEGTTSDGLSVLPFRTALLQPALHAEVAVQPVALRFHHQGHRSSFAAYIGEETLLANLWRVMGQGGVLIELEFLPAMGPAHGELGRHELADRLRSAILQRIEAEA